MASFSVQVNGELAGYFRSARGLRQGCSLLPYLFVICMDVLSKMLDKATASQDIGYHPRCKNLRLTHLCFADNLMILSDGKVRSVDGIVQVLNIFAKRSGLTISMEKTTLYLGGVSPDNTALLGNRLLRESIRELDSICSAFLWSGLALNAKKAKFSWTDVCKPKCEGGLGLRSLKETNDGGFFWSVKPASLSGSWMWKHLLKYRDLAKTFAKVEVNNGTLTSFWYDNWSAHGYLLDKVGSRGGDERTLVLLMSIYSCSLVRRYGEVPTPELTLIGWLDKQIRAQLLAIKRMGDRHYALGMQRWLATRY
ncbi:PREDICTED: uncharacterized protein LOC104708540 [Camelina sativa]|uniref:Uncharacterized protein LOC104708540 n=1 Tax=Camelina sativa TaxID=90675 RepID=A0ABM0TAU0_CAMSA|nr:PREDICTED: uncharacterized protein LOC104708540 [Camelina sativa]